MGRNWAHNGPYNGRANGVWRGCHMAAHCLFKKKKKKKGAHILGRNWAEFWPKMGQKWVCGCATWRTLKNPKKKKKRKEKRWGAAWPHLSAPRGSWVLRCGWCPCPFAQEGCRPSVLSMAIPAISGDVDRQEGSTVIVFDVVFPSMGSDRRDYRQKVSKIAVKKKGKFLTFLALFTLFINRVYPYNIGVREISSEKEGRAVVGLDKGFRSVRLDSHCNGGKGTKNGSEKYFILLFIRNGCAHFRGADRRAWVPRNENEGLRDVRGRV